MQKKRWEDEYANTKGLRSSITDEPSKDLVDFIQSKRLVGKNLNALDIGSGLGRNAIYLAQNGYFVDGIEISEVALELANKKAIEHNLQDKVLFKQNNAGEILDFEQEKYDLVLDMMVLHLLNKSERDIYSKNVYKLLKPGGIYFLRTIASDGTIVKRLIKESPGHEANSYILPQNKMVEKTFTKKELKMLFYPLRIEKLNRVVKQTPAFDEMYDIVYYLVTIVKDR